MIDNLRETLATLSPPQARAVTALVGGATHAEAAVEAGVARETVSRWLTHHPAMRTAIIEAQAAAAAEQAMAAANVRGRAIEVAHAALDAIATSIEDGTIADPVAALRAVAPMATASPPPPVVLDAGTLLDSEAQRLRRLVISGTDLIDPMGTDLAIARLAEAADVTN